MKRIVTRLISVLLLTVMCISMLPVQVFAWGKMTHIYTANVIEGLATEGTGSIAILDGGDSAFEYDIPDEFYEAIMAYPDAFRAGALGPDVYPDIFTGQVYIHPEDTVDDPEEDEDDPEDDEDNKLLDEYKVDSGMWVVYLCDAVNKLPEGSEDRKMCLSFTLGCILHYCGDLYGHDFVNTFSGGAFPSFFSTEILDIKGERLNNILSHLSIESYMDDIVYPTYDADRDGGVDGPDEFISGTMVFDGSPAIGLNPIYVGYPMTVTKTLDDIKAEVSDIWIVGGLLETMVEDLFHEDTNNVPPHYTALLNLRTFLTSTADEYREHMEPISAAITLFCDRWAEDVDAGIVGLSAACDNIARRLVTGERNKEIDKKTNEERLEEQNKIWTSFGVDMDEVNLKHLIFFMRPDLDPEKTEKEFNKVGIYGDSFFDTVLVELVLSGAISMEMLDTNGSAITIIKEELSHWMDEYGSYLFFIPDVIIDGIEIPVVGDLVNIITDLFKAPLYPIFEVIKGAIKDLFADWVISYCTGKISDFTGWEEEEVPDELIGIAEKLVERLEHPEVQLDHEDNPYRPTENNFADLKEYMDILEEEAKYNIADSEFEALYNTITMFQLVLMGPENYSKFIKEYAGVDQTSYRMNTGSPEVTSLKVRIKTSDLFLAGTNDNIYLVVEEVNADGSRTQIKSKLLDHAAHDDFEQGDMQTYTVELPETVKLSQLEIGLKKTPSFEFLPGVTDDWVCENIRVTPMYAGYELTAPIDLGGVSMAGIVEKKPIRMSFQDALKVHEDFTNQKSQMVTNLKVEVKVKDELYAGTDDDIYLKAYFGNTCWKMVLLDKGEGHNDLERGETEIYNIPITNVGSGSALGIPLDQLNVQFWHTDTDEANWEEVKITPCFGTVELTAPISVGGKALKNSTWTTNFNKELKKATYYRQEPSLSQTATRLDIQVNVANKLGAGTDDDIFLYIYSNDSAKYAQKVELDKDGYNDFEQNDSDVYTVVLEGAAAEIPLDQMRLVFEKTNRTKELTEKNGSTFIGELAKYEDEANWDEVIVTAYNGSQRLTDPISVGGTKFDDDIWDTDFVTHLKMQCTPVTFEYKTNVNGRLLAYMDSLDGGEEWVDDRNELWDNTKIREKVFLQIFKGFAPEIEFEGPITMSQGDGLNLDLTFTGVWNGVSMERRSQVKDFEYNPAVEGTATISIINARGSAVCTVKDIPVADNAASLQNYTNNKLKPDTYDLKVTYTPDSKNPMYSATEVVFEKAITVTGASEFTVKVNASPTTGGTVTGGGTYKNSASVTVTATPKSSYEFKEWTKNGQTVSTDASYSFIVQEDCTLYAVFVPKMEESFYVTINDGKSTAEAMVGETIRLDSKVTGGMEPYKYQWYVRENGKTTWQKSGSAGSMSTMILDATLGNNGRTFKVEVTDPFGKQTSSNEVTIVVNEPVAEMKIKTQPEDVTAGEGNTAVFFVEVTGGRAPYTYHWQMPSANSWTNIKDSATYSGLGTNTLAFKASKNSITQVRCIVMDSDGNDVTSRVAKLTVTESVPLVIQKQPSNSNVKPGTAASLTVEVSGGKAPYTYTWQRFDNRWENVTASSQYSGLGTATLSFTPSTAGTTQFRCVIKDSAGNEVTSNTAQVNAIADPLLLTQPSSATIDIGASASLKVGASGGTAPYTYSWQINMGSKWSPVANNSLYSGQGTDTLTVKPNKAGTTEFRCVVKDSGGKEITSVTVKVTAVEVAPLVVKTQPKDAEIEIGSMTILTVAADGGKAPYSYSWQIRTGDSWAILRDSLQYLGQGTDTLLYMPNKVGTAEIRCLISDSAGNSILSSTAYITAKETATQLTITTQPSSATTDVGKTVSFTVGVSGGKAPYTYTWQLDGGNGWYTAPSSDVYTGQGTNILRYTPKYGETYRVRCVITDSLGNSVTSNEVTATAIAPEPIVIFDQPKDRTEPKGIMLALQVSARGGAEPLSGQWQGSNDGSRWINLNNGDPGIEVSDTGMNIWIDTEIVNCPKYMRCVISDGAGQSVTSRVATITIQEKLKVKINDGETEFTISHERRETVVLTANVTGGEGPYTYTWYVQYNGDNRWIKLDNVTTSSYEVQARSTGHGYSYKVEVKDSTGKTKTSQVVRINIPDKPVN